MSISSAYHAHCAKTEINFHFGFRMSIASEIYTQFVSEWACAYCAKSGDGDACGYWGGGQNQNDIMSQWRWWGWQQWLWWCCWLGWWRRWWLWWCTGEGRKETIWRNGDRNKQSVGPWIPIKVNIIIMVVMMIMMVMLMVMIITMMMMMTMLSHHQRH